MTDRSRPKTENSRRDFLRVAVAGVASGSGALLFSPQSAVELEGLMARARAADKPPLTLATLNALLRTANAERDHATLKSAKADVKAFVRSHFTLTSKQENDVDSLSREDIAVIRSAIDAAISQGVMDATCRPIGSADLGQAISNSDRFQASVVASNAKAVTLNMTGF